MSKIVRSSIRLTPKQLKDLAPLCEAASEAASHGSHGGADTRGVIICQAWEQGLLNAAFLPHEISVAIMKAMKRALKAHAKSRRAALKAIEETR